ncbi:MAG: hypothetical protein ACK5HL_01000 [Bacilli bacterium]
MVKKEIENNTYINSKSYTEYSAIIIGYAKTCVFAYKYLKGRDNNFLIYKDIIKQGLQYLLDERFYELIDKSLINATDNKFLICDKKELKKEIRLISLNDDSYYNYCRIFLININEDI